jgi:hypothetical protein
MNSRTLVNLALLLLVGGLVLVVLYEPGKTPPAPLPTLTAFDKQDIKRIAIGESSAASVLITRQDGEWRVESPAHIKADSGRIDSLLRIVTTPSHAEFSVSQAELSKYGLAPPRAWLQLNDLRIDFGGTDPVNHRRYVRLENKVHLITDLFYHHLVTEPASWFSSALLPDSDAPVMLKLPEFTLQQQPDGSWHSSPETARHSADTLNRFVENWSHARAQRVTLAGEKKAGSPIEILLHSGTRIAFTLLQEDKDFILVRDDLGVAYHLSSDNAGILLNLPVPAAAATDGPGNGEVRTPPE